MTLSQLTVISDRLSKLGRSTLTQHESNKELTQICQFGIIHIAHYSKI